MTDCVGARKELLDAPVLRKPSLSTLIRTVGVEELYMWVQSPEGFIAKYMFNSVYSYQASFLLSHIMQYWAFSIGFPRGDYHG